MKLLRLALLLLLAPLPATAQQLLEGTLFTNAEERAYLDFLRQDFLEKNQQQGFDIEESQIPEIPVDGPAGPSGPAEYSLSGIMRRSDGTLTIWLNDQHLSEQELPANASLVREGNSYALRFITSTGARLLRPGQTLTLDGGTVQERFQRPPPVTLDTAADVAATPAAETAADKAAESQDAADGESGGAATSVASAAAASSDAATQADTASLIDKLPDSVRNSAEQIQSMINNLQSLQESISEVTDPE